ncbi:MAG: PD40 domain-containing protein [Candidatus Aminicenantes bacterium]|nr:MAG: PD40 domain-containing protein [Candidatus Aminicenantes bacterium]
MSDGKIKFFTICLLVFFVTGTYAQQDKKTAFPHLAGKYFGQKVPVLKAELFAPGLISLEGRYEFALSFSPDGDELLFTVQVPKKPACVYNTRIVDGRWTKPKPVSLSKGAKKEEMEAFFSLDGRYIFFAPYDEGLDVRLWKVDILDGAWHNPQPLKGQISDESAFFPTSSKKGALYYSNITQKKIYKAFLEKGIVQESYEAGLKFGGHGFIAPDENFILVDSIQDEGFGKQDIYVAFRNEDGGWSKPVNLGDEVNTEYFETCPTLSSDGKYLFFSRYNEPGEISNIYWIDSRVIENARKNSHAQREKPEDDFPVLKGSYLGQKPPGMTPEIFAPGILNTKNMGAFCSVFSPDGNEFYFVYYERENDSSGGMAWMKRINNVWTKPDMLHFNSTDFDNDMCMSSGGEKLIFRSWRTLPNGEKPKDHSYLWFVERTEDGWSKAKPLHCGDVPVRTGYPSLAANGNLYFAQRNVEIFGIYRAKPVNGAYSTPEYVFTAVDSIDTEGDMFVAPDESYLIISCWDHPDNIGSGQGDLYITFRKDDGTWTEEINMGELINTQYGENCPQVSPDGKYFFFNRYNPDAKEGNIYWVDAKIIENLKPEEMK